jgi:hypothetical protein
MTGRRTEISGTQVVASALATVTGAIAASYLGIAGTIIGAAVVSVATTAGGAIYTDYLGRTAGRLRAAAPMITHRTVERATAVGARSAAERIMQPDYSERAPAPVITGASDEHKDAGGELTYAGGALTYDGGQLADGGTNGPGRPGRGLRARPGWLLALMGAGGIFLAVIAAITVFELAVGRPLDAVVWHRHGSGTSVGQIVGAQGSQAAHPRHSSPATRRTPPASPPGGASSSPASPSPSSTPAPSSGSPSPSPSPTVTGSPSPASSATGKPKA